MQREEQRTEKAEKQRELSFVYDLINVTNIQTHVAVGNRPPVVAAVDAKANVNEYESVHDILSSIVSENY